MKVKPCFSPFVVLLLAVSLLLPTKVNAQINNYFKYLISEAEPSQYAVQELFEEIEEVNDQVDSVTENVGLYFTVETDGETSFSKQWALLDILFDQDQAIKGAILYSEFEEDDQLFFEETFLPSDEKAILKRSSENDEWVDQLEDSSEDVEYFANPHYHLLMDSLINISDNLEVYEDENYYIFFNNDQDLNLFDEFQPHFNLYVSGLEPEQLTTDIMVSFDKETLLLKEFIYISYFEDKGDYIEISVTALMEKWNEYQDEMFNREIINDPYDLEEELEDLRDSMNLEGSEL